MGEEMVQLYTVNGGKPAAKVPARRYETVRQAVRTALAAAPEGLTLWELCPAVAPHLPQWWFDEGWDTPWHVTGTKLHLEYLGELERVPKTSPHKVRLVGSRERGSSEPQSAKPRMKAKDADVNTRAPSKEAGVDTSAPASPKSPKEMHEAMARNLPGKTGRTLASWVKLVKDAGITDWKHAQAWLKREHSLTTMYAYMVAGAACEPPGGTDYSDEAKLLADMYAGPRAHLRPIHDRLWALAQKLGPEVQLVVCKTYCSFRAQTQFAVVKPTTQAGVDLGLALPPATPYTDRLVEAKNLGGGDRNRHRVRLANIKEIDAAVRNWLQAAYEWDKQRKAGK